MPFTTPLKSKLFPLIQFAEALQIPVVTAFRRFDAFPNFHPNYIGSLGLSTPAYLLDYINQAVVVLGLGTRFSQITTQDYTLLTDIANLIHVDVSPDVIGKVHTPSLAIAADINEFLKHLLPIIEANNNPTRKQLVSTLHEKYIVCFTPKQDYQDDYVDMDGMIYDFIQNIPKDSIITTDAGNFYSWLSRYYRFEQARTFLGASTGPFRQTSSTDLSDDECFDSFSEPSKTNEGSQPFKLGNMNFPPHQEGKVESGRLLARKLTFGRVSIVSICIKNSRMKWRFFKNIDWR
ncbi:hypothetical protein [Bacillus salipaludis]|uniref:Thiamine pyrophosphate enzyme central domain-containing protein n=1 Tax=Bacillus salipaludis TaxID=2547811 RepID=A0ABW8RR43_9BACI